VNFYLLVMAAGNRRHISADVKESLVFMSASMTPLQIQYATGINKRTVNRVLCLWRGTGCVVRKPLQAGRPRILNALDIAVSFSLFMFSCLSFIHVYTVS
jgi:hypothetical protein